MFDHNGSIRPHHNALIAVGLYLLQACLEAVLKMSRATAEQGARRRQNRRERF
jgi:hypothetical protein